jgi:hypothetical protein
VFSFRHPKRCIARLSHPWQRHSLFVAFAGALAVNRFINSDCSGPGMCVISDSLRMGYVVHSSRLFDNSF